MDEHEQLGEQVRQWDAEGRWVDSGRWARLRWHAEPAYLPTRQEIVATILTRSYKDRTLAVTVLDRGFEFEGQRYASLSAVAQAATGAHWSGIRFFGLLKKTRGRAS